MLGFPTQRQYLVAPALLAALILVLNVLEPHASEWLGFYPELVIHGDWWRVITGQLLHTNDNHMWLNLAGLVLVWALHGEHYRAHHFFSVVLLSLILIGTSLMFFVDYGHYAGLSGVLHCLLIYGGVLDIKNKDKTGWLLLAGVTLKVAYEVLVGPSAETEALIGAAVAFEAHLLGVISGALLGLANLFLRPGFTKF